MSDIKTALIQYNAAMEALEVAEKAVQDALFSIKTAANASTVQVEGQFFQVRERKDKLYLCELSGKPRGRPKGSRNAKTKLREEKAAEALAALEAAKIDGGGDVESVESINGVNGVIEAGSYEDMMTTVDIDDDFIATVTAESTSAPPDTVLSVETVEPILNGTGSAHVETLDVASA